LDTDKSDQKLLWEKANEAMVGPRLFSAIETVDGNFCHNNFDIQVSFKAWTYTFDFQNFIPETVKNIGVAANDKRGF